MMAVPSSPIGTGVRPGGNRVSQKPRGFPNVAGAPANYWTHLMVGGLWVGRATLSDPDSYIDPDMYEHINAAVLESCDALDGVSDGVLEDPARCRFDPAVLECREASDSPCLTPAQTEAVRKIYGPVTNPRTGEELWPGLALGSEPGWVRLAGGPEPFPIQDNHFKYVVFEDTDRAEARCAQVRGRGGSVGVSDA